jgi:geranylgeranyl reductase family protein
MPVEVVVVGAGPAGIAAALTARERGLRTVVVDKAEFPRDKTCGDGLTANALRLIERLGLDVRELPDCATVREAVLVSPSGRHVPLPMPPTGLYSAVVPRRSLDAALVELAARRGVAICTGKPVHALRETDAGLQVDVGDRSIDTGFVIAADGHWSKVRRLRSPGAAADLGTWHAFRQYFREVDDPRQWVLFEPDLVPGYAWVFPLPEGRANVGFGVLRSAGLGGRELKERWHDLLGRRSLRDILGPRATPEGAPRAWPIPGAFDPDRLTDGRVLFAGDAAGVVDPMTGEGVAQALETGMLAAESIARGRDVDAVGSRYRSSVGAAVGRDLRFAARLQRVLSRPLGARAAIRAAGSNAWTRRNFARWMFEDYPRALVLTPDRWRRGVFTGTGAFAARSMTPGS